ncbi:hypothetical protein [Lignipirellula cremea]|uniref:Uncharacterized protein n=1 Tax=Lignipirellula cremea TaxID=2528010 RepID=A0A518DY81_9BACT|nr:hypothetical protein [Lignipirellula cremea]QDU96803.1 hypothetical protein Pla8534_46240 [Lignipirellula cremea]
MIVGRVVGPGLLLIGDRLAERFGGFPDRFFLVADRDFVSVKAIIARLFGRRLLDDAGGQPRESFRIDGGYEKKSSDDRWQLIGLDKIN